MVFDIMLTTWLLAVFFAMRAMAGCTGGVNDHTTKTRCTPQGGSAVLFEWKDVAPALYRSVDAPAAAACPMPATDEFDSLVGGYAVDIEKEPWLERGRGFHQTNQPVYVTAALPFPVRANGEKPDIIAHVAGWVDIFSNYFLCGIGPTGKDAIGVSCEC